MDPYQATGPNWLIELRGGFVLHSKYKLKYGKKPFRHLIVCEADSFDHDPADEEVF